MGNDKVHAGHRQRLREKFLRSSGRDLEDHEILELLLFNTIPVRNTNDLAHNLLQRFGSVRGVFDADMAEIAEVDNIGEKSALLIKIVASCISRYGLCEVDIRRPFKTFAQISEYLQHIYIGEACETVYLLMFNNSMRLIRSERICTGSVNDVMLNIRLIVEKAYDCKASAVILAHNHPGGIAVPSGSDIEMTYQLSRAMSYVGINFIDHFVVAANRCSPILHSRAASDEEDRERAEMLRLRTDVSELEKDLNRVFCDKNS